MNVRGMNPQARFVFAAVHRGPYLSINPLENELGADGVLYLVEGVSKEERIGNGLPYLDLGQVERKWRNLERFLQDSGAAAVIRSTSEDVIESNVEHLASVAAGSVGIPVFVIEDFPGNYWTKPGERFDALFVEDDITAGLHKSRGVQQGVIYSTGNPRYNELSRIDTGGRREETRMSLGLHDEPVMLWAGQPDGDNSYWALTRILDGVPNDGCTLLFRAHPRDAAYRKGAYAGLLANSSVKVLDASTYPDTVGLYCASDLVMTQFSSAGVEASYLGVPAVFVLFDDLGKQYLRSAKGYDRLPWCEGGCAFLIEEEQEVKGVLEQALFDSSSRETVRTNFQHRFGERMESTALISNQILALVREHMHTDRSRGSAQEAAGLNLPFGEGPQIETRER